MDFGTELTKTYPMRTASVQNVAYALSEFLDTKKNMVTQTMRSKNGYIVQCKGDANAEWTKYIGLDASVDIKLIPMDGELIVEISTGKWVEKLGIAALGSVFFQPLLITSGIGAIRQMTLPNDVFKFIEDYLGVAPVTKNTIEERVCPHCGAKNGIDARFCSACGQAFPEKEEPAEPVEPMTCPKCGKPLEGTETFCSSCGTKLKD